MNYTEVVSANSCNTSGSPFQAVGDGPVPLVGIPGDLQPAIAGDIGALTWTSIPAPLSTTLAGTTVGTSGLVVVRTAIPANVQVTAANAMGVTVKTPRMPQFLLELSVVHLQTREW